MAIAEEAWVVPTDIPFKELRARDLEECVFWLLDAMGARDLEWRTGGSGGGAADGGRDLEATFYVPSPDGEMEPQRWWIECKGRNATLQPDEVKAAANNATARAGLAYLVVVTNTTFSNPTRDWVKAWQAQHPLPKVRLWDHEALERLLSRHPAVVLRLFSEALSPAGLLKVVQRRFWDKLEYTPAGALETFWAARDNIDIDAAELLALVANEFAHGSIVARPWAAHSPLKGLVHSLHTALANLLYLSMRASKLGADQQPLFAAIAHMILVSLQSIDAAPVARLAVGAVRDRDGMELPDELVEMLVLPVVERLLGEMQDVCSSDCSRVLRSDPTTLIGADDPLKVYWRRLDPNGPATGTEAKKYLLLESFREPCKVGYQLNKKRCCPLFGKKSALSDIEEVFSVVKRVSAFRRKEALEKDTREAADRAKRFPARTRRPPGDER